MIDKDSKELLNIMALHMAQNSIKHGILPTFELLRENSATTAFVDLIERELRVIVRRIEAEVDLIDR